ncbi:tyrosine--tRNA ligase [Candidatus Parcubacteria bacterium]|nr:tyrosine--tRNA ligase [Candidatus Parcubacteria bacterium]
MFTKNKIDTDPEKINKILTRNIEDIFVLESFKKKLESGKQLRIKLGFDPTGSNIHIGRATVLRKLREFQDLGHKIVFIVGDFTARVGDPSDKLEKRPMLDSKKIKENLRDYKRQVGKIIDLSKTEFVYNSKWLSKLDFNEIAELAESFTVSQMISRRNFKDRLDKGQEVSLREFLYPLMQGYDSVMVNADIEIGGFDQLFNLKAGRTIQKYYKKPEQDVLTTVMLEGTDGRKMSTSWGNVINIVDEPNEMFGKVMSLNDELIGKYFKVCTDVDEGEIKDIESKINSGELNPRDAKVRLAKELIKIYHSEEDANKAEENFEKTFKEGGAPEDVLEVKVNSGYRLDETLIENKIISSKNEWRRLIEQKGITVVESGEKVTDLNYLIKETQTFRVGKKRFIKSVV